MSPAIYHSDVYSWIKSHHIPEMNVVRNSKRLARVCYFKLYPAQINDLLSKLVDDLEIDKQVFLDTIEQEKNISHRRNQREN